MWLWSCVFSLHSHHSILYRGFLRGRRYFLSLSVLNRLLNLVHLPDQCVEFLKRFSTDLQGQQPVISLCIPGQHCTRHTDTWKQSLNNFQLWEVKKTTSTKKKKKKTRILENSVISKKKHYFLPLPQKVGWKEPLTFTQKKTIRQTAHSFWVFMTTST